MSTWFRSLKRHDAHPSQLSIIIVTAGVTLVTLSGSSSSSGSSASMTPEDLTKYTIGIGMMVVSLLCTGVLGMMQEKTYKTYGPCWKEGVFYTVCRS